MSAEGLFAAIGGVGDDLVAKAEHYTAKPSAHWQRWLPLAACAALVITVGAFALRQGSLSDNFKTESAMAPAAEAAPAEAPAEAAVAEEAAVEEAPESAEAAECWPAAEEAPAENAVEDAVPEKEMEPENVEESPQEPTAQSESGKGDLENDDLPPRAALLPELTLFGQTYALLPDYQDTGAFTVDTDLGEVWAEVDDGKVYILGDEYVVIEQDMLYPRYVVCFTADGDVGLYQIQTP